MAIFFFILMILLIVIGVIFTVIGLPGTWFLLAITILYATFSPADWATSFSLWLIIALSILAIVSEGLEVFASSLSTKKVGGSRRASWFALIGSILGAISGGMVSLPMLPLGVIFGSCCGAMAGGILAEYSHGESKKHIAKVGIAAFVGRLFGTVIKIMAVCSMAMLLLFHLFI